MLYKKRYLEEVVARISKTFKILYLGGPRQVGKTTLLAHLATKANMKYVSLDEFKDRNLAKNDPELFVQKYRPPLFIDEVQYAPELFSYLKMNVDASQKYGQYWLTGSQQFSIMKNVKESLAGRVGILNLLGFSMAEEKGLKKRKSVFLPGREWAGLQGMDIHNVFRIILRGSFPELLNKKTVRDTEAFYNSYLQTYLDRDLRDIFNVAKIETFHKFLRLCAARTGQILNCSELAKDADISVHAAREWLNILETGMHIYLLRPYYRNISKRLIKAPKLYFLDTGLAAFLTSWKTPETLMDGAMAGAFFETFAVSEIIKSFLYRGEQPPLYYFRDKEGHEVDILIERDGVVYPLEVKMAANISSFDLKNINYFRKKYPSAGKGAVISLSKERLPIDRENEIIPISMIS